MSRPDEGLIHQWLDGECTPEESVRLEQLVATDPEWASAVAEARGLIAASSRIVQSLDAVPRAMPVGSVAAPRVVTTRADVARAPQRFVTKPWMRIAAALVLVAGTAYVLRERTAEPFVPVATVDMPAPAPAPAMTREEMTRVEPPTTVPPLGAARTADRAVGALERGATQGAPAPVLLPQSGAQKAAAEAPQAPVPSTPAAPPPPPVAQPRVADLGAQRRLLARVEASRGTPERILDSPNSISIVRSEPGLLDGCWRVSAPPELIGVLERPVLRRQSGDTLVLITSIGDVTVVRTGDMLQGALMARAEPCKE